MRRVSAGLALLGLCVTALAACSSNGSGSGSGAGSSTAPTSATKPANPTVMQLTSPAFTDGGTIPTQFTCGGVGNAPPLRWSSPPAGTEELALLVLDPDAGQGFVHQLGWGISPSRRGAPQNHYGLGGIPGMNGLGRENWTPPCPPSGGPHHYEFTVYALARTPQIAPTANVRQFLDGIRGSVLAEGHLTGLYGR